MGTVVRMRSAPAPVLCDIRETRRGGRPTNAERGRPRVHLTPGEVDALISAAKAKVASVYGLASQWLWLALVPRALLRAYARIGAR